MKKLFVIALLASFLTSCVDTESHVDDINADVELPEGLDKSELIQIHLSEAVQKQLAELREVALDQNVIIPSLKVELPGELYYNNEKYLITVRLKGDWTDHLKTDKWSFRIKITDGKTLFGMKSFSIQSPKTRQFLNEYIVHKLFEKEDVLTTRYHFNPIAINGKYNGVYAIEEHFDKYLIENSRRREAPILKIQEDDLWATRAKRKGKGDAPLAFYDNATITLFKKNKTFKKATLKTQFETAREKFLQLKENSSEIEQILDLDVMAKYQAICDVTGSYHSMIWHNRRFYYNPVSDRLEPIGFDCNPEVIDTAYFKRTLYSVQASRHFANYEFFTRGLLNNETFLAKYKTYVKKYSSKEYEEALKNELNAELNKWGDLIANEYVDDEIDYFYLAKNLQKVRDYLPELDTIKFTYNEYFPTFVSFQDTNEFYETVALKGVKIKHKLDSSVNVYFKNFHLAKIQVFGYGLKRNTDSIIPFANGKHIELPRYQHSVKVSEINLPKGTDRLFYKVSNLNNEVHSCNLSSWAYFQSINFKGFHKPGINALPFIHEGQKLTLKKGSYTLKSDVEIPEGYEVFMDAGVKLNMTNGISFVTRSPIEMNGTEKEPIIVTSSDSSSNGFVVLSHGEKSTMNHVQFSNLSNMNKHGWILTGAVTIFQSDITIDNCSFVNNNSEDGLNMVRCSFTINNSTIDKTTSDGFDADFCSGEITNSKFLNTGNDAIDVSGAQVNIDNVTMIGIGDKAVSGGENSQVTISNSSIDGALTAIASKDKSNVTVEKVDIKKVHTVFAAFKKKPEFGPAIITVKATNWTGITLEKIVDKGSQLVIDSKQYVGDVTIDIDSMYAQFGPK